MRYLIDTGILLRLVDTQDSYHGLVQAAFETLGNQRDDLYITTQNVAELWNVATRPLANNGLNLPPAAISQLFQQAIEPFCTIVTEPDTMPTEFRRLLLQYSVVGKQVHDARLVAMMLVWQIENILTLNDRDFRRYQPEGITIVTPASIAASGP
ncbi:MAG: PIN domain-containing protein [Pirellulales bacterium]